MAGVFDFSCAMQGRHQALGYREVELAAGTNLGGPGERVRGHEFHYSQLQGADPSAREVYRVFDRYGRNDACGGYLKANCLASYVHLHFGSNPAILDAALRDVDGHARAHGQGHVHHGLRLSR